MTSPERWSGRIALMVAHCAGMIDLVALPVWVGTLIAFYQFDAQQAGGLATLFLSGAVASSIFFARRLHRIRGRVAASVGYGVAALAFGCVTQTTSYALIATLHLIAGASAACGLTFTHGTIARSANPHRLFAIVGTALGLFAIAFLGGVPHIVAVRGGSALFVLFSGIMAAAAIVCAVLFPTPEKVAEMSPGSEPTSTVINTKVWLCVIGIACMALVQAMVFSFLERAGMDRGFGADAVTGVLITLGIVNLVPAILAAVLERRIAARTVVTVGPIVQLALALLISQSTTFSPFAVGAIFFAATMIFTHTFAFGLVAKLDKTGRVLAATPAMLMVGAAIGPVLGGTLVKHAGYGMLGVAAGIIDLVAVLSFICARHRDVSLTRAV